MRRANELQTGELHCFAQARPLFERVAIGHHLLEIDVRRGNWQRPAVKFAILPQLLAVVIRQLAAAMNVRVEIDLISHHYPGKCWRIEFYPPEERIDREEIIAEQLAEKERLKAWRKANPHLAAKPWLSAATDTRNRLN